MVQARPHGMRRLPVFASFLVALLINLAAGAVPLQADSGRHIILMRTMPVPVVLQHSRYFVDGLAKRGLVPGENLKLTILRPNGDRAHAEALLRDAFAQGPPDLVATSATMASQAAHKLLKGTTVPQVFFTVSDPVGAGLVKEIGLASGNNLAGVVNSTSRRLKIKTALRLLGGDAKGKPIRFGYIHADYASSRGDIKILKEIAATMEGVRFISNQIDYHPVPQGIDAMLAQARTAMWALEDEVDYWWQPLGPLGELPQLTKLLRRESRRPVVYGTTMESVRLGALFQINPNAEASGDDAAHMAVEILNGRPAGSLPVNPPSRFDLGLNLSTATGMGIVVPAELLDLAGSNVFWDKRP